MSLTVASTFALRTRCPRSVHTGTLSIIGTTAVARNPREQRRGYRFGRRYSSYIDPDIYRRLKDFGYNYCENFGWHPSWKKDRHFQDAISAWKRVVCDRRPADDEDSGVAGRKTSRGASSRKTPDNPEGIRPGRNIEDAERAPLEHLLFGGQKDQGSKEKGSPRTVPITPSSSGENAEVDYIIDPITNRKVPKKSSDDTYSTSDSGVEIPVTTFKSYRSQFASFNPPEPENTPVFSDGQPPEAELKKYEEDKPWESDGKPESKPPAVSHYGAPRPSLMDSLSKQHKSVRWHQHEPIASMAAGSWSRPTNPTEDAELRRYTPVLHNEPDGKAPGEQSNQQYEDLHKYGPVKAHEPDGMYKAEHGSLTDLAELGQDGKDKTGRGYGPNGKFAANYTEAPDEAELAEYSKPFLSCEPDGKYAANHVWPKHDEAELARYSGPFFSHEPDGKYAASYVEQKPDEADLARYKPFRSHEPDGKYAANHVVEKPDERELATYGPFRSHEPDGMYAASHATAAAEPPDLRKYEAFRSHEPDGKYAAEAEAAAAAAREAQDLANHEAFGYEDAETRPPPQECQENKAAPDLQSCDAVQADEPHGAAESTSGYDVKGESPRAAEASEEPNGKGVEEVLPQPAAETAADGLVSKSEGLTGNYMRDFPEEFSKSWATESSETISPLLSSEQKESDGAVQPALERITQAKAAPGTGNAAASPTAGPAKPAEPALYKILVYDPTMQCIETAETTSAVPDNTAPLTPAEVLLRISNPAKFFPHFAPLQAQGFEIVSGGGDVLIFRKVREAVAEPKTSGAAAVSASAESTASAAAVNPIDMTGERSTDGDAAGRFASPTDFVVAASRFASPTGFVNYDLPPEIAARSDAEAGRPEAPGREQQKGEAERPRKGSLTKKAAIGAAWLAGFTYSVGVVSEYFKSGGSNGKGPKGL